MQLRLIEVNLNNMKGSAKSQVGSLNIVKMPISHRFIYKCNTVNQNPYIIFLEIDKLNLKHT